MANPNLALRNMPKNPFWFAKEFDTHDEAEPFAEELKAQGFEVRIVPIRNKFQKRRTWRVLKRERVN